MTVMTQLRDGVSIPQIGFGVFLVPPDETQGVVEEALRVGYRHIDTAAAYRNERGVGAALAASGLARDEVFVTTKLWNSDQGYDEALRAFEASRERLGLDFVDLYLIHWPLPDRGTFPDSWRAMERIRDEGGARTIGVSNFRVEDLERLARESETTPTVNQVELHPGLLQEELREWHERHGIATEAWGPLGQGTLLDDETVVEVAGELGRTPAQTLLRWHLQLGNVVIPKSVNPTRIAENFDVFDFQLDEAQMEALSTLEGERVGPDPATFAVT